MSTSLEARRELRHRVYAACYGRCCYCGHEVPEPQYTLDHLTPVSQGGRTVETNLVVACRQCNQRKGARSIAQFFESLPGSAAHFVRFAFTAPRQVRQYAALIATQHS